MALRLGIDLGGTKIEAAVVDDADGRVVRRERVATESARGYEHVVERVGDLGERLLASVPDCAGLGIGTPGAVSSRDGRMKNCNTTCLNGRALPADLARRLGRPVRIENDANCFALAEARLGAGRGARLVFGVIMGTGVGGGIVIDGRLWRGAQHIAGEWGHHAVDPAGPECYCGRRGCVETLIAGPAVERRYRQRGGLALRVDAIAQRARAGEELARAVVDELLEHFGRSLANLIAILDPDVVVLGGGLSNLDELYEGGRVAVARYLFNDEMRTPLLRNQLGDSAGVIGAALLDAAGP
jgi:fructokinase